MKDQNSYYTLKNSKLLLHQPKIIRKVYQATGRAATRARDIRPRRAGPGVAFPSPAPSTNPRSRRLLLLLRFARSRPSTGHAAPGGNLSPSAALGLVAALCPAVVEPSLVCLLLSHLPRCALLYISLLCCFSRCCGLLVCCVRCE